MQSVYSTALADWANENMNSLVSVSNGQTRNVCLSSRHSSRWLTIIYHHHQAYKGDKSGGSVQQSAQSSLLLLATKLTPDDSLENMRIWLPKKKINFTQISQEPKCLKKWYPYLLSHKCRKLQFITDIKKHPPTTNPILSFQPRNTSFSILLSFKTSLTP